MARPLPTLMFAAVTALLAAAPAFANETSRTDLIQAPVGCVPRNATDDVRFRVTGVRNAGAEPVDVICSMAGDWDVPGSGSNYVSVRLYNTSATEREVACTLYAGPSTGTSTTAQGSVTKSQALPGGATVWYNFGPSELPGAPAEISNPTVICRLPQRIEVQYVYRGYSEEVGS